MWYITWVISCHHWWYKLLHSLSSYLPSLSQVYLNFILKFFFKDINHYFRRNSRIMFVSLVIGVWAEYKFSQKKSGSFIISADVNFVTRPRTWINAVVILRYHIEGNFQERKLSRIDEKYNFRDENFRRLLAFAVPKDAMPPNIGEKTFTNSHKTMKFVEVFSFESFLPYGITCELMLCSPSPWVLVHHGPIISIFMINTFNECFKLQWIL